MQCHSNGSRIDQTAGEHAPLREFLNKNAATMEVPTIILHQGDTIDITRDSSVFILASGRLTVGASTPDGSEVFVTDLAPGEIVGESTFFGHDASVLTVTAAETAAVWALKHPFFRILLAENPVFAVGVVDSMCRRLCRVNQRLIETSALPAKQRLYLEILRRADKVEGGILIVTELPTHDELAKRVGSQREVITKELSRLRKEGIIERHAKGLRILEPHRLSSSYV